MTNRYFNNTQQDGDLVFTVNKGGTPTEVMRITGADGYISTAGDVLQVDKEIATTQRIGIGPTLTDVDNAVKLEIKDGSNARQFVVLNTGEVGIGVETPTSDLHVGGEAVVEGKITGPGAIPLGSIVPVVDTYSNVSVPATGTANQFGLQYCDGATLASGHTLGTGLGGNTPDLTDGRFLRGSSSSGTTGGSSTKTLIEANLPAHSHTMDHGHADTFSIANDTHNHGITDPGHNHDYLTPSTANNTQGGANTRFTSRVSASTSTDTTGITINNDTHNHAINGSVTDFSGSTGSTGSGTAFSIEPQYLNVKYLIRVK